MLLLQPRMPGTHGQQGRDAFASCADQGQAGPAAAWRNQADEGGRGRGGAAQRRNQGTLYQNFPSLILSLAVSTSPSPPHPPPQAGEGKSINPSPHAGEGRVGAFDVSLPILLAFSAALCLLISLPLSWLVYYSVHDRSGGLTVANFAQLATDPTFLDPLVTTIILALSSAVICCAVAAPMGWLVARTDMPLRRTVRALVTASFVTPPFLGAVAWELLAAPNSGLLNKL